MWQRAVVCPSLGQPQRFSRRNSSRTSMRRSIQLIAVAALYALCPLACGPKVVSPTTGGAPVAPRIIQSVVISGEPMLDDRPLAMNAARNETTSTVVQLSNLPPRGDKSVLTLRIQPLQLQSENA